ncbi:hypothetical protein ACRALDRAFT_212631 [Sodiomyces alcalophilus JCM 7366]|uniref:uncharacterized protein n=1 Tax=Sodiomyces alcalophilus JCM 7366 TaxID=591952 RepID=UPI0039B6C004
MAQISRVFTNHRALEVIGMRPFTTWGEEGSAQGHPQSSFTAHVRNLSPSAPHITYQAVEAGVRFRRRDTILASGSPHHIRHEHAQHQRLGTCQSHVFLPCQREDGMLMPGLGNPSGGWVTSVWFKWCTHGHGGWPDPPGSGRSPGSQFAWVIGIAARAWVPSMDSHRTRLGPTAEKDFHVHFRAAQWNPKLLRHIGSTVSVALRHLDHDICHVILLPATHLHQLNLKEKRVRSFRHTTCRTSRIFVALRLGNLKDDLAIQEDQTTIIVWRFSCTTKLGQVFLFFSFARLLFSPFPPSSQLLKLKDRDFPLLA